jgi:hypothetical protein
MARKLQRGGYIADFSTTADNNSYMLYLPPAADNTAALATSGAISQITTPGLQGGGAQDSDIELKNGFFYSMEGGCAYCSGVSGGRGAKKATKAKVGKLTKKGGVGLELAPFISALALLGARFLVDEEVGMFNAPKAAASSKKGGSRARRN